MNEKNTVPADPEITQETIEETSNGKGDDGE